MRSDALDDTHRLLVLFNDCQLLESQDWGVTVSQITKVKCPVASFYPPG